MTENHSSIEITTNDARQSSKENVVRYVLGASLILAVVGVIAAYLVS